MKELKELEEALRIYAIQYAQIHHRQINKTPIAREMLYIPLPKLRAFPLPRYIDREQRAIIYRHTTINECQLLMLLPYSKLSDNSLLDHSDTLISMIEQCDNRWISDTLSSLYTRILDHDRDFLHILKKRNTDANPRKRRQSLVSLYYYARSRKNPLDYQTVISLVDSLIDDKDYYVQKGLGRTLRELYNTHPEQALHYSMTQAHRISPHAWTATTEKLSPDQKNLLTQRRKMR